MEKFLDNNKWIDALIKASIFVVGGIASWFFVSQINDVFRKETIAAVLHYPPNWKKDIKDKQDNKDKKGEQENEDKKGEQENEENKEKEDKKGTERTEVRIEKECPEGNKT